jgi:hypothetical protein
MTCSSAWPPRPSRSGGSRASTGTLTNYEGGWVTSHSGRVQVGRAIAAMFMPFRPDFYDEMIQGSGRAGRDR